MRKVKRVFEFNDIIEYFRSKNQGEQINYQELQSFTHYNLKDPLDFHYFKTNVMRRVKEGLIDYGMIIKAIPNVGYYILKSNQIQSYTYRTYIKRPLGQLNKAKRILDNTDLNGLKTDEVRRHKLTIQLDTDLIQKNTEIINSDSYKELE